MSQHASSEWRSTTREATWSRRFSMPLLLPGKDIERLTPADLSLVDEFHTGGRTGDRRPGKPSALQAGMHILDIGCGIGGPSRYFAEALAVT